MSIKIGMELYWPKSPNRQVLTVAERYGDRVALVPDFGGAPYEWNPDELEECIAKGYAVEYTGAPKKVRLRLHFVDGKWCDFGQIFSAEVEGRLIYIGVTTFSQELVGASDENGRLIRKRSIIEEVRRIVETRKGKTV